MGAAHGNAEALARLHVRGRGAAADVGRAAGAERAVEALRPAQAELQHRLAGSRDVAEPRRLGRHQGLEVDDVEDRRLDELADEQGRLDPQQRLPGEDGGALRDRGERHGQVERRQRVEEAGREKRAAVATREAPQIVDVLGLEAQPVEKGNDLLQPRRDGETAAERGPPHRHVEAGPVQMTTVLPVALGHRQLVEVGGQSAHEDASSGSRADRCWYSSPSSKPSRR